MDLLAIFTVVVLIVVVLFTPYDHLLDYVSYQIILFFEKRAIERNGEGVIDIAYLRSRFKT